MGLPPEERAVIQGQVKEDAVKFIEALEKEPVDLKSLGILGISQGEVMDILKDCYGLRSL